MKIRRVAWTMIAALTAACTQVTAAPPATQTPRGGPAVPFGGHRQAYAAGTIRPAGGQAALDRQVIDYYFRWKAAFVKAGCGHGWRQVFSPDADHPYVAEGQGYGMVVAVTMAGADPEARAVFDGLLDYVLAHPSVGNPDLLAAEQNAKCRSVNGSDSATDGDLDVAYALLMADRQWGGTGARDYRALALKRIAAIKKSEINPKTHLTLLGDWSAPDDSLYYVSRTSDWLIGHFRAFREATGDPAWDTIRDAHQRLIQSLRDPATGLLPDFAVSTDHHAEPARGEVLEDPHDGAYWWNACRDPWRIGVDALISGDPASLAEARTLTQWITAETGGDPEKIAAGYTLAGRRIEDGPEPAFVAPFAVAAAADPGAQRWLDALWRTLTTTPFTKKDYYSASVQLQSMIAASGNAWTP